jgi:uncharacterized protein YjbJ (UPF0337 family)
MDWRQIEQNWIAFKSELPKNWGRLSDEDISRIIGRREELASRLQERYGMRSKRAVLQLEEAS